MSEDRFPPLVLDGSFVLHQFYRHDPLAAASPDGDPTGGAALHAFFERWSEPPENGSVAERGWSGLYRIVGGGVDYLALHVRPSLDALSDAERELARTPGADALVLSDDYLSVVELGLYHATADLLSQARADGIEPDTPAWSERARELIELEGAKRYAQARLHPRQPDEMPWVCFYPMDKRRGDGANWYGLPLAERARLMGEHGRTGRRYAGRISQVISGSVGLDDWEWAVTLFSADPLDFKALVTEMRYDEVTTRYGEFGSFRVGRRVPAAGVAEELHGG